MTTVGRFLQQKLVNMTVWLRNESGMEPAMSPTVLMATTLAEVLATDHKLAIQERDFDGLLHDKENFHPQLQEAIEFVQGRPDLHDKFWRYLLLFSETVSTDG